MIYNQQQWNNVNIQNYNQFRVASQNQANNYEKDLDKVIAQRNFKYGAFFFDLPLFVTKEIIYQHLLKFFNYQSILQIVVPKDHSSGLSKQIAFIQLESFEESLLFRKKINHTQIYGHSLKVGIIAADEKPNSKEAEDLVLGIPSQINDISSEKDDKPSDQIVLNSQYSKRNKNYTEVLVLDIPSEIDHQTFDQIISDSQYKNVLKVNLFDDPYNILIQDEKSQKFNSCYIQFDRLKVAMKFEKAVTSKQFQLGQRKSDQVWEEVKNEALGDYVEGKVISLRCYVDPITNQNILLQDYERVLKDNEVNDEVAEQKMVEEVQQRLQDYFKGFKILSSLVKISPVFKQPRVYLCFQTMEEYKDAMKMLEEEKDRMKGMNKMNAIGEQNQEGGQQQSKSDAAELQIKASGFNFTCQLMHRKELWKERELYRDGKCIFMKNLKKQIIDTDTNQLVDLNGEILKRVLEKKVLPNSKKLEVVSCQVKSSEYHNTNYAIVFLTEGNHIQEVKNFARETGSDLNKLFEKEAAYVNILHHKVFHKDHTQKKRNRDLQGTLLQNKNTNNMFRSLTQQQIFQQQAQFMVPPGMNFPPNLGFMPPSNPLLQGMPPGMPFPQFQRPFIPFAMGPNIIYQQPPFQQPLGFRPQYQPPFNPQQSRVNNNFNNNNFSNAPYYSNNNYNNQQANRNPIFQQRNTQSQAPQRFNNYNNNNHNNNSNNFQQPNQNRRPPQQNSTYPQQQNQASRPITQNNNFQNRNNNNLPQNNNNNNQQRRPNTQQTNTQPATRAQGVPVPLNRQPIQVNAVPLPINLPIRPGQPPVQQKPPQQQK